MNFAFGKQINLKNGQLFDCEKAFEILSPIVTPSRLEKIQAVSSQRNFAISLVLENIYDRGNTSAVMRTAEAFGYVDFHQIVTQEKFKVANRVASGADKWIENRLWPSSQECISFLKERGQQLVVTSLQENSKPMAEVDFSRPTALVLGNEKEGASAEMIAAADHVVVLPMSGFVQSFNISVAGALCIQHIFFDRKKKGLPVSDLTEEQKRILQTHYLIRTLDSAPDILERFMGNPANL